MPLPAKKHEVGIYKTCPEQFFLRLTTEQKRRLQAAAKYVGKTMTDLGRDGIMRIVAEIEEERRLLTLREQEDADRAFIPKNGRSSRGLGLRSKKSADDAPTPAAAPTIVVQAPPSAPTANPEDLIAKLAAYVVADGVNAIERERRAREAAKMLTATAKTKEDAERMAKELDAKVAEKKPKRSAWSWLGSDA